MHFLLTVVFIFFTSVCFSQQTAHKQPRNFKFDYKNADDVNPEYLKAAVLLKQKALPESTYGLGYNTCAIYHDYKGNRDSAFFYYKKAISKLAGYPLLQNYPIINLCTAYNENGEYNKALQLAAKGLEINKKNPNTVKEALLYHAMGISYFYRQEPQTAVTYFIKGIDILKEEHNTQYLPLLNLSLANTYIQANNYEFACELYEDYLNANKNSTERIYYVAQVNYAECLIALNDYKKAKNVILSVLPAIEKMGEPQFTAVITAKLGYLEHILKNTPAAVAHYKKAVAILLKTESHYATLLISDYINILNSIKDNREALRVIKLFSKSCYNKAGPSDRLEYQKAIAETYTQKKDYYNSTLALNEAVRLTDSLRLTENGTAEQEIQAKFQTKKQRENNEALKKQSIEIEESARDEHNLVILYLIISAAVFAVILSLLRSAYLKNRLQKTELKAIAGQKILAVQQHQYEQQINNRQKEAIEEKHRELTSYALRLASYQDNINDIINKCGTDEFRTIEDVKRHLKSLITQTDYWKQFETRFNNLHPEFISNLTGQFPKLTKNDLEFCTLLRLNLSNKEIASLLQISHESVITKKYRIKKKTGISDDSEFEKILSQD